MKPFTFLYSVLWALTVGCFLALSAAGQTHVYPTNNPPPADQDAIQTAINNLGAGGGSVVIHSTFNFGPNDGVQIIQPNVTLTGADDATIVGGGKFNVASGVLCVISVDNVGAQIRNLTLRDYTMAGIVVWLPSSNPTDNPVAIADNTISTTNVYNGFSFGIYVRKTGCPVQVLNNDVAAARMVLFARLNTGDITVSGNTLTGGTLGMICQQNSGKLTVSGNTLSGLNYGANFQQNSSQCIVTDNTLYTGPTGEGLYVAMSGDGPVLLSRNNIHGGWDGIYFYDLNQTIHTTPVEISNNIIEPSFSCPGSYSDGINAGANHCPVNIINNSVRVIADKPGDNPTCANFGMILFSWNAMNGLDQDNPPILVKGNEIEIRYPFPQQPTGNLQTYGFVLGRLNSGIKNVTVESNKISGTTTGGIYVNCYDRNILIDGNDLSGLSTWSAQMSLYGREMVAQNNILGFANQIPGYSVALELASMRPAAGSPMPYPTENCTLSKNDYRLTGLPGWSESSNGCIVLHSYADLGGLGTEVKNNLVFESGGFPRGTGGAKEQVLELKTSSGLVHDNRIVGLPASGLTNPGIGQRLKAIGNQSAEMLAILEDARGNRENGFGFDEGSLHKSGVSSPRPSPDLMKNPALPVTAGLLGNYPNPFNPTTRIQFSIVNRQLTIVKVFDVLGRVVATLVNEVKEPGTYTVQFDAAGLAGGVYFYRLQAGDFVQTKRLLLLK